MSNNYKTVPEFLKDLREEKMFSQKLREMTLKKMNERGYKIVPGIYHDVMEVKKDD